MAKDPRPGDQLASAVCSVRLIVIRAPLGGLPGPVECGGKPLVPAGQAAGPGPDTPADAHVTLLGKRYVDDSDSLELLCTHAGPGRLTLAGVPLAVKAPKPLPASD
jgi:hypothetical protein